MRSRSVVPRPSPFLGHGYRLHAAALLLVLCTVLAGCRPQGSDASEGGGPGAAGDGGSGGSWAGTGGGGAGSGGYADPCRFGMPGGSGGDYSASLIGDSCYAEQLPEDQRWLLDPATWKPMPGNPGDWNEICYGFEAKQDKLQFEPLKWEPCGPGCEVADLWQGIGTIPGTGSTRTRVSSSSTTALVGHFLAGSENDRKLELVRLIDLSDGSTKGGLSLDKSSLGVSPCNFWWRSGLDLSVSNHNHFLSRLYFDTSWDHASQQWVWRQPGRDGEHEAYCDHGFMEDGFRRFFFCGKGVFALLEPTSSHITRVDQLPNHYARQGDGEGDLIAWPEMHTSRPSDRVRGWAPDGLGPRTLLEGLPPTTCAVSVSPTHLAGFSVDFRWAGGCDQNQPNAKVWIHPRTHTLSDEPIRFSPVLIDRDISSTRLTTWGPYVAVLANFPERVGQGKYINRVALVRTTDWKVRWVEFPDLKIYDAAVGPDFLYVAPTTLDYHGRTRFLYRYDLTRFDEIGTDLP